MKRKAPSTAYKKGQSGNPAGGRKLPEDIRAARNMSYEDMMRTVIIVRGMTTADAQKAVLDCPLGMRAIINAYAKLDYRGIKDYEDRLWGKAKENIDLTIPEGVKIIFENKTDGGTE